MVRHEQLWAPWRLAYVSGESQAAQVEPGPRNFLPGADPDCFICRGIAEQSDRANLLVERTARSVVILNRYPYNNGHLLVAPLRHEARLDRLSEAENVDLARLLAKYVGLIERLMSADGFNVGLNVGRAAGAGVPGHLHWHLVPRWNGDTNFMPSMAGIRVIPQALDALWELLHDPPPSSEA